MSAYELILDGSTVRMWYLRLAVIGTLWSLTLALALFLTIKRRQKAALWLAALLGVALLGFLLSGARLSPYAHYRRRLEPSVALGEELFRRYEAYRAEKGHYPASVAEVYFDELEHFDWIAGMEESPPRCDGIGLDCRTVRVLTEEALAVQVYDRLIECTITNLSREWRCRDHR